jgi:plasmid stabilization system protein ParE
MNNKLIIRPEAESDISEAYSWYNDRLLGLGSEFINCIDDAINSIMTNPESYTTVYKNIRRSLIRRFPYAIYYIYEESNIVVLAVFHFKRNPKSWLKRT